jgi:Protein of unknown function (DUF1573)
MLLKAPSLPQKFAVLGFCVILPALATYRWSLHAENADTKELRIADLFVPQSVIDVGTIWSGGQRIRRVFQLQNRSDHAIRVNSVTSDCGCTVPEATSGVIEPDQTFSIPVDFWPPAVMSIEGGSFRRTILAEIGTTHESELIPLHLIGFIAANGSLQVSPSNLEFDTPEKQEMSTSILHFKGYARLLENIPSKLVVTPGLDKRIVLHESPADNMSDVRTKDVAVALASDGNSYNSGEWTASLDFAPDENSGGLRVHLHGRSLRSVAVEPKSVILANDSVGAVTNVKLREADASLPLVDSIETDLPLGWSLSSDASATADSCTIRLWIKGAISHEMSGTVRVQIHTKSQNERIISIPALIFPNNVSHK